MKRIVEWRVIEADPSRLEESKLWGYRWRLRRVICETCGNEWWETVEPAQFDTTDSSCACNEGRPWWPGQ